MLRVFVVPLLALVLVGCATYVATSGRVAVRDDSAGTALRFSDRDRVTVVEYYRAHRNNKSAPRTKSAPTLRKHHSLPPDLRGRPLPRELESRLASLSGTHTRLIVGRDLVLIDRNTRVVADILYDVLD